MPDWFTWLGFLILGSSALVGLVSLVRRRQRSGRRPGFGTFGLALLAALLIAAGIDHMPASDAQRAALRDAVQQSHLPAAALAPYEQGEFLTRGEARVLIDEAAETREGRALGPYGLEHVNPLGGGPQETE